MKASEFVPGVRFKLDDDRDESIYHYDLDTAVRYQHRPTSEKVMLGLITAKEEDSFELTIFHLGKQFKNSIPYDSVKLI
jgi:hypothetical protein